MRLLACFTAALTACAHAPPPKPADPRQAAADDVAREYCAELHRQHPLALGAVPAFDAAFPPKGDHHVFEVLSCSTPVLRSEAGADVVYLRAELMRYRRGTRCVPNGVRIPPLDDVIARLDEDTFSQRCVLGPGGRRCQDTGGGLIEPEPCPKYP